MQDSIIEFLYIKRNQGLYIMDMLHHTAQWLAITPPPSPLPLHTFPVVMQEVSWSTAASCRASVARKKEGRSTWRAQRGVTKGRMSSLSSASATMIWRKTKQKCVSLLYIVDICVCVCGKHLLAFGLHTLNKTLVAGI